MIWKTAPARAARVPVRGHARFVALVLLLLAAPVHGAAQSGDGEGEGRITGMVRDATTGEAVAAALVRLREIGRTDMSHGDGSFHLEDVREGTYRIVVERLGYAAYAQEVEVRAEDTTELEVDLQPSAISLAGIVVTGFGRERGVHETYQPTSVLSDDELDRNLASSLAATISHEPGISMKSFGSAPAQPVIRGLGGDRVLVLEDGNRTGDMSTTGPDHAVGVDPVTAERIEVVRGPAGLLYGSSALGGVINVIREEVPRSVPETVEGRASLQGESVNRGLTGALRLSVPVARRFAVRGEFSARGSGDTHTPEGALAGTEARGYNAAVGASWVPAWGFLGGAYREYLLDHGVPSEFGGEMIPGAHPGGTELETRRRVGRVQAGHFAGLGPFSAAEVEGNLVHYTHDEIELGESGEDPVVGTAFDQLTATLNASARHDHDQHPFREEGALGAFLLYRDLRTGGSYPNTRDSQELNLAAFAFEELVFGSFRLQAGARYDWLRVEPVDTAPIAAGEGEIRTVATRAFGDLSASLAGLWEASDGWILGASVARAFRAPSVRELFSAGPHLADFSYDIGNPDLDTEVGFGTDLFVRVNRPGISLEATVFRNHISNFIHYYPTGRVDPRGSGFPVFEARGENAVFLGADGSAQWEALSGLVLDATVSYVRADYQDRDEPLPAIPPLNVQLGLRYETGGAFFTAGWHAAADQHRVPRPIEVGGGETVMPERPTDGYALLELGAGYHWTEGERSHSITVNAHNALDTAWRDHLSRAKQVAPEPGRNVQLLYRISF